MSWISKNILQAILLLIIAFIVFNMYTDVNDYFYTKQISFFDDFLKNNII